MDIESAKRKVAKLIAIAKEGSGATEGEADNALRQAEALMRKYDIEAGECVTAEAKPNFDWSSCFTPYGNKYHVAASLPIWYQAMAVGVANFTDTICRAHTNREQGMGCGFYGEQADVIFAVWLTDYLKETVQRTAVAHKDLSRAHVRPSARRWHSGSARV